MHSGQLRLAFLFLRRHLIHFFLWTAFAGLLNFLLGGLELFHLRLQGFHAELDLLLFPVHVQDFGFDLVALLHDFVGCFDIAVSQLTDMDHARALRANIHKGAVGLQADDFTFDDHIGLNFFPVQGEGFNHRQLDAILLHSADPDIHALPLFDYILNLIYGILAQLRNVDDARNGLPHVYESACQSCF